MSSYIRNVGITKSFIQDNNKKSLKEIEWMGEYDGKEANIQLHINDNGKKEDKNLTLDKEDLMNLLNMKTVNIPLEERLFHDFLEKPHPITSNKRKTKRRSRFSKKKKSVSRKNKL